MRSITYTTNDGLTYTRVTKARARKLYNAGIEIGIHPCNLHPTSPWTGTPLTVSNKSDRAFDAIVNEFEYYNCCSDLGRYASFYEPITK